MHRPMFTLVMGPPAPPERYTVSPHTKINARFLGLFSDFPFWRFRLTRNVNVHEWHIDGNISPEMSWRRTELEHFTRNVIKYRRPGNPHTNRSLDALTFARSMLYKTYCGRPSQSDDWEIAKTTQYKPKHPNRG